MTFLKHKRLFQIEFVAAKIVIVKIQTHLGVLHFGIATIDVADLWIGGQTSREIEIIFILYNQSDLRHILENMRFTL